MAINAPEIYMSNRQDWHQWLLNNASDSKGIWLVYDKGANRVLSSADITEEALCFGWIDSVPGRVSDTQSKIYVSPRKPQSAWSKLNKERVARLTKSKLMKPAGLEAVRVAKLNGAWNKLNNSDNFELPQELSDLLAANPKAKVFYDKMPPSSHRIILEWIYAAKTEETRLKRIGETVELAAKGIKANHYRQ
ncbi:MAG TPA: YdeI/OmpD-associated family protein [Candidatus Saccharimonadales bacterium]|nr:YdeI/OmpD-associated family protein [Candidatus Saccharimonadales bacterium]